MNLRIQRLGIFLEIAWIGNHEYWIPRILRNCSTISVNWAEKYSKIILFSVETIVFKCYFTGMTEKYCVNFQYWQKWRKLFCMLMQISKGCIFEIKPLGKVFFIVILLKNYIFINFTHDTEKTYNKIRGVSWCTSIQWLNRGKNWMKITPR